MSSSPVCFLEQAPTIDRDMVGASFPQPQETTIEGTIMQPC